MDGYELTKTLMELLISTPPKATDGCMKNEQPRAACTRTPNTIKKEDKKREGKSSQGKLVKRIRQMKRLQRVPRSTNE